MARQQQQENAWKHETPEVGGLSLKAENIAPAKAAVITVTEVDRLSVDDPDAADGKRTVYVLRSEEYPERGYFPNKTSLRTLMSKIGPTPAEWEGERVPLEVVRTNNPREGGKAVDALWVVSSEDWDDALAAFDARGRKGKATAARAKGKRR